MLLACSRQCRTETVYFTSETNKRDVTIASNLAKELQISHKIVPEKWQQPSRYQIDSLFRAIRLILAAFDSVVNTELILMQPGSRWLV